MCNRRVVDRKNLKHALPCFCYPVNHLAQVAEVAHTKTTLAAQRENRNHCSGSFPAFLVDLHFRVLVNIHRSRSNRSYSKTIKAFFPNDLTRIIVIQYNEFKVECRHIQSRQINGSHPFIIIMLNHWNRLLSIPFSKCFVRAANRQSLSFAQLRRTRLHHHCTLVIGWFTQRQFTRKYTIGKCRRIEERRGRYIRPDVRCYIQQSLAT